MLDDIVLDGLFETVDRRGAKPSDRIGLISGVDGKNNCAKCHGDLDRNMADTASANDQDLLPLPNGGPVDQAFPRRHEDQWQRCRLTHAEIARLQCQQIRIHGGVLGEVIAWRPPTPPVMP